MADNRKIIESIIIVSVGMAMHLNCISMMEFKRSKLSLMKPNAASSMFVFSILCILSKMRMIRMNALRIRQTVLVYLLETALIQYVTEILLRHVWFSCVRLLKFLCRFLSQYVVVANEHYLEHTAPYLSSWIRNDAFELGRLLLAFVFFIFMIDITGAKASLYAKFLRLWNQGNAIRRFERNLPPINEENEDELDDEYDSSFDDDEA